ncbi:MAG TPA: S-layer homology domain-containing protein [Chloroflexia bacterium]
MHLTLPCLRFPVVFAFVLLVVLSSSTGAAPAGRPSQSSAAHFAVPTGASPGSPGLLGQHATPLGNVLSADGSIRRDTGFRGSLDARGYRLVSGAGEQPRFALASDASSYSPSSPSSPSPLESLSPSAPQSPAALGDENWDDRFGIPGVSGLVYAIAVAGESIYVGGDFTTAGDIPASDIARWDGTNWHPLGAGLYDDVEGGFVLAISIVGTDIYVGGDFMRAGDVPANGIAMWDGTSWHPLGAGLLRSPGDNGFVYDIKTIGSDIYVGGIFTTAGEVTANGVARWDGSQWSPLGSGLAYDTYLGSATDMAVAGGNLYVAGSFNHAGGVEANRVARWDGSQWHSLGEGPNNGIPDDSAYALAADGNNIYVGGSFLMAGSVPARNIARWDGTQWFPLGTGTNDGPVRAIAVNGSDVYAGGNFSTAGSAAAENIARWDGTEWHALGDGVSSAGIADVFAITPDGADIYVGGDFTIAGQVSASRIAKWSGTEWIPIGNGPGDGVHSRVNAIALRNDEVFVGGIFTRTGEIEVGRIAKWDGAQWSPLGSGIRAAAQSRPEVKAIAVSGTDIYVGGNFIAAGDVAASNVAKWDGNQWSSLGSGVNHEVLALAVSDGYLYAGGRFTSAGDVPARGIAKWDGAKWSALGAGDDNGVGGTANAIAFSGSNLYVGGSFTTAGVISATNIAAWDGSSWRALGSGVDDVVLALAAEGETVYAGGSFATAGGVPADRVAKWTGIQWEALGTGVSDCLIHYPACRESVNALAIGAGGLYAGGKFLKAGGVEVNYISRWDGSRWSPLGSGVANGSREAVVYTIAINSTSTEVYVGGAFTAAGGKSSNSLGLWHTTCRSSFSDVTLDSPFYAYIRCLACSGIISGYADGTFRPNNDITRGQIAKVVANAAGYNDDVTGRQTYTDVPATETFWLWIERLSLHGAMGGYPCGGVGEPCDGQNRPYFRPSNNATRGQLSKIVSNAAGYNDPPMEQQFEDAPSNSTFYTEIQRLASRGIMGGYPCGGVGEPCIAPDNRPYFRPTANVTRGQASKIVANTFHPNCVPQAVHKGL